MRRLYGYLLPKEVGSSFEPCRAHHPYTISLMS